MTHLIEQFKAARRAGTPLIAIRTFDPEALIQSLQAVSNGVPVIQQDCVRGWKHRNDLGAKAIATALKGEPAESTMNATASAELAANLPDDSMLFMLNAHRFLDKADFTQALWNLRDPFASKGRTFVLLGPHFSFPAELQQDVLMLDEPLPTQKELKEIVLGTVKAAKVKATEDTVERAVHALRGLAAFPAEQATAMSVVKTSAGMEIDIDAIRHNQRKMIEQTDGLSIWYEGQKFSDAGGLDFIKTRLQRIIKGKNPPTVVVWIDEIEKFMAGAFDGNDSSGTAKDQLGFFLTTMQDKHQTGLMAVGVSGSGKSLIAKIFANEAGVLCIKLDLGALFGGIVGESQAKVRQAMKVIEAVGGDKGVFYIATSNDIRAVKPELKRRFKKGIWFFDLPDTAEKDVIWEIFFKKFPEVDRKGRAAVDDSVWTGAEIETCVQTAWEENITLAEAAEGIVPVAVSAKEEIERMRAEASGRYNSASYAGVYRNKAASELTAIGKTARQFGHDMGGGSLN